jgi:hypothetical protein
MKKFERRPAKRAEHKKLENISRVFVCVFFVVYLRA